MAHLNLIGPEDAEGLLAEEYAAAVERGKAAVRKLQEQGIIDSHGRRIRTDLPADMRESDDRDFGG